MARRMVCNASRRSHTLPDRRRQLARLELSPAGPELYIEMTRDQKIATAVFPSLPTGIEATVQLVGDAVRLSGAWAIVNSKPISSLTKLWQRLACYRESLDVEDPLRYCGEKSALFNILVSCEEHRCPVPCQFICTPCMRMERGGTAASSIDRFKVAAELGEIDWCPRLQLLVEQAAVNKPRLLETPSSPVS